MDLMQFQDCVAIVSLQSRAIMKFTRADQSTGVLLEPGDLLLLQGPARCCVLLTLTLLLTMQCLVDFKAVQMQAPVLMAF